MRKIIPYKIFESSNINIEMLNDICLDFKDDGYIIYLNPSSSNKYKELELFLSPPKNSYLKGIDVYTNLLRICDCMKENGYERRIVYKIEEGLDKEDFYDTTLESIKRYDQITLILITFKLYNK